MLLDEALSVEEKLLARYQVLHEALQNQRYPGCLFIAACSFYPDIHHPIHQITERQKQASLHYTRELLTQLETDDPEMVAKQMELILEGCLSRLMVKHHADDIATARRLAEDVLRFALCRNAEKCVILTEKSAINVVLMLFLHKPVDGKRPIRFNAPRCPDSSVGRAGD